MEWHDPSVEPPTSAEAFAPKRHDRDGISLSRALYVDLAEAARGPSSNGYYVAVMRAGDLLAAGIDLRPDNDPVGHVTIPALNYSNRKSPEALRIAQLIATRHCIAVEGPFGTETSAEHGVPGAG
jgi:hypothetical protein